MWHETNQISCWDCQVLGNEICRSFFSFSFFYFSAHLQCESIFWKRKTLISSPTSHKRRLSLWEQDKWLFFHYHISFVFFSYSCLFRVKLRGLSFVDSMFTWWKIYSRGGDSSKQHNEIITTTFHVSSDSWILVYDLMTTTKSVEYEDHSIHCD